MSIERALLATALLAGPAPAEAPSGGEHRVEGVTEGVVTVPGRGAPRPLWRADVAEAVPTRPIAVTPLGPPDPGAAGVLPTSITGLPRDLWAGSDAARLLRLVETLPRASVPAIDNLARTLMLAEADPPRGASAEEAEAWLLARVDRLIERGALDAARALLDRAGGRTPERRRRAFDAALLLGDETAACRAVDAAPRTEDDYARRVFCLLRGGDWAAGALTFDGARALGALDPVEAALLASFIDEEAEPAALPPAPAVPSPLAFRLYDALGHTVPTGDLPVAFARADLRAVTGWKAQLEAAERLARVGAIDPNALLAILTLREPPASGGVWDRVAAVQALDAALSAGDAEAVAEALPPAWDAMRQAGTLVPLAEVLAPRLEGLTPGGPARATALHLALLASDYEEAARSAGADDPLVALAMGERPRAPEGAMARAVAEGFDGGPAPDRLATLAGQNRLGEALLTAAGDVGAAVEGDLEALPGALRFLRRAGLEDVARRAALQLAILEG